jgi:Terpene cyclase DEP1
MPRTLLLAVLIPFTALSAVALWKHGYWGIFEPHFQTFGAGQVLADLAIALMLVLTWMVRDARQTGRRFWPWMLFTLAAGSFGPLLYLLTRKRGAGGGGASS